MLRFILFSVLLFNMSSAISATIVVTGLYEVGQGNVALTTSLPSPLAGEGMGVRGKITHQYIYSPYGTQRNLYHPFCLNASEEVERGLLNQTRRPLNIIHNQFGYTGQSADPSTGLMMLGAFRNYAPGIDRFIQPDTYNSFSKQQINNKMMYGDGNPIRFTDPTGHVIFALPAIFSDLAQFLIVGGSLDDPVGILLEIEHSADVDYGVSGALKEIPGLGKFLPESSISDASTFQRDISALRLGKASLRNNGAVQKLNELGYGEQLFISPAPQAPPSETIERTIVHIFQMPETSDVAEASRLTRCRRTDFWGWRTLNDWGKQGLTPVLNRTSTAIDDLLKNRPDLRWLKTIFNETIDRWGNFMAAEITVPGSGEYLPIVNSIARTRGFLAGKFSASDESVTIINNNLNWLDSHLTQYVKPPESARSPLRAVI